MPRQGADEAIVSPMRFQPPCSPERRRTGLTVVEVLAALVILSVGLLGMAGTSALSLRAATAAARERRVVAQLELRLAALAAAGCRRAAGGVDASTLDGIRVRWTVAVPAGGVSLVEAAAEWIDGGRLRSIVLRSALLC